MIDMVHYCFVTLARVSQCFFLINQDNKRLFLAQEICHIILQYLNTLNLVFKYSASMLL